MTSVLKASEYASNKTLFPIWDPDIPFPSVQEMCDLDIVTHVSVEKARMDGYRFLLEATIARYRNRFYMAWANHKMLEPENNSNCLVRGCTSDDGVHWNSASIWMQPPTHCAESFNHPLLFSTGDKLYAFVSAWYNERPTTEIFLLNDLTGKWDIQEGCGIANFVPFCAPQRMDDGNWIMSGSDYWFEAAVVISCGDDLTQWEMIDIPRDSNIKLRFPETSIIKQEDRLLAFCRPYQKPNEIAMTTAPVSESYDNGRTWKPLGLSNFPMAASMPYAGKLSTGQNYLITNSLEDGRYLLSIAVTEPKGKLFKRIFKIRHQQWPMRRVFGGYDDPLIGEGSHAGKPTEWSYPKAIEHDEKLYVAYAQGKEDCCLSIIPIETLAV